jgi:phage gp16-like protein
MSNPARNALIAKIKVGQKQLGMDDDTYRDFLEKVTGKRSAAKLSIAALELVVNNMKEAGFKPIKRTAPKRAGTRPMADGEYARKIRALWISLYHLGIVADPTEAALATYVKRQTKVDALQFLTGQKADRVIESLKKWAKRAGKVDWSSYKIGAGTVYRPRQRVIEAQWQILRDRGVHRFDDNWHAACALSPYCCGIVGIKAKLGLINFTDQQLDQVMEALGKQIRASFKADATARAKAKRGA